MTFSLLKGGKTSQILAIDLGSRTTKAVLLDRVDKDTLGLSRFVVLDAPIYDKTLPQGLLAEHLRNVVEAIQPRTKQATIAIGSNDSLLRSTELPLMPLPEMRQMLKFNSKNYLQQDLRDYVFDCYIVPPRNAQPEPAKGGVVKYKVWVGGAKREALLSLEASIKEAGLIPNQVTLAVLGPINALERAQPDVFAKEVVALVDLGFKSSSISILDKGELCLSRSVEIGGDKLTTGLAEAMNVSYAEAEGMKVGKPQDVEVHLQPLIAPLGRELRASMDFFEHQRESAVSKVLVSGGAARSEFILQLLQMELAVACQAWFPTQNLKLSLPPQQMGEVEHVCATLTVAIGSAAMSFA